MGLIREVAGDAEENGAQENVLSVYVIFTTDNKYVSMIAADSPDMLITNKC